MVERRLEGMETALTLTSDAAPFNIVCALHLKQLPPAEMVRSALEHLRGRHPLLRTRIVHSRDGLRFEPADDLRPCLEEMPAGPYDEPDRPPSSSAWVRLVEQELSRRLDPAREPLLQCHSIRGPSQKTLVLTMHHAVTDGASLITMLGEMLRYLAGEAVEEPPLPEQPPPAELFPGRYAGLRRVPRIAGFMGRQLVDELRYRLGSRGQRQPPCPVDGSNRILTARLGPRQTTALIRTCRRWRTPAQAVMNAALLLALRSGLYSSRASRLRYITFADLRRKLRPPLEGDHLGAAMAMLRLTAEMPPGEGLDDLETLAHRVSTQVHLAGHRGEPFLAHLMSPRVMSMMLSRQPGRMAATALSYTGPTRLEQRYGDLEVTGLHAFVSNIHIGPEIAAQARLLWGELWWDVIYLAQEMSESVAQDILDHALRLLELAGEPESEPA